MRVLVVDIGGTNVKILAAGQRTPRKSPSGPGLTPRTMVAVVKELAADWEYDAVAIGYPGVVRRGRILVEPHNLGRGWVGFDFKSAFKRPVRIMNDAAMQALGNYKRGLLLFLGFGTGLGSALVADGVIIPMELGHLSFREHTYEHYVGARGLERMGREKWLKYVKFVTARFIEALKPDHVVLGGGNAKKLTPLPKGCVLGKNSRAFTGGFRMWENEPSRGSRSRLQPVPRRDDREDPQRASL